MTTNDLFSWSLTVIIAMSAFVGALLPDLGVFAVGGNISVPGGLDFIFGTIDAFVGLMTFTIPGMPMFISLFSWGLSIIILWCIGRWLFGG